MRELEERVGGHVHERAPGRSVPEHGDHEQRDLIGDHVADGPPRDAHEGAHGRMTKRGKVTQVHVRAVQRRQQREGHHDDARRRAEPHEQEEPVVVEYPSYRQRSGGDAGQCEEHRDDDDVVEDRSERRGREAPSGIEHRGRERRDAVEQHLRHEEPQQVSCQRLLLRTIRSVYAQGVEVDDPGREEYPDHRDREENENRNREDRGGRIVVVRLEVPDEQRHEGRGEDAPQEQLVDDVGRLVRVAVRARQCGDAERIGDRRDAHEPGDS